MNGTAPASAVSPVSTTAAGVAPPASRAMKPPPSTVTPPAPAAAPPVPPMNGAPAPRVSNGAHSPGPVGSKGKKKNEPAPVDPAAMYESLRNRIAALEEEEVHEGEEERRFAEEAQSSVKGMTDSAVHAKYIELFAEFKRLERDHAKEKQKLLKDKDAAKSQLTKANSSKVKMENLARELQKDNKRLRDDNKRLAQSAEEAHEETLQLKADAAKRTERARQQGIKYRDMPDIVVKVVCRYRAELFFKISRKTKLSRLFDTWTDRMANGLTVNPTGSSEKKGARIHKTDVSNDMPSPLGSVIRFIFTHGGRDLDSEQTPEEAGIEDGDEILAVELMDLTEGPETEIIDEAEPLRQKLQKHWTDDPTEAKRTLVDIFNGVVRERLKEVLRQYELRERHFECVIRSKELEVLLSRARAAEQRQLAENEKMRVDKLEEENQEIRRALEDSQNGQTVLIDKLIQCCKEPNAEKTQRLFASLREELEKRGISSSDQHVGT